MYLAKWAVQVLGYYFLVVVPLFVIGLLMFYPDPEYGGFIGLLAALEAGAAPEAIITTIVTTILIAALPERYRRPLW